MRTRLTIPAALFAVLAVAAAATGSRLLFLLAAMCLLTVVLCLAGVLWASVTMRVGVETSQETVYRGDDVDLTLWVRHRGWIPIRTHYGYSGWIRTEALRRTNREELIARAGTIRRVSGNWADLYAAPKVQGKLLTTLPRGSFVNMIKDDREGWSLIRDAAGNEGWVHTMALGLRQDGTVAAAAADGRTPYVSGWTDIVDIGNGGTYCVGIRKDGTLVFAGDYGFGDDGSGNG